MSRTAVVLFNLGGPDRPESVRSFLFNLFFDPAIIGAPAPVRWPLAWLISRLRARAAGKIYAYLGGQSPLLGHTMDQAGQLTAALGGEESGVRVFIAMRYWHPMSDRAAAEVKSFAPDRVVLLPLYPQFSTTTTGSSLDEWARAAAKAGLEAPTRVVCCYPTAPGFVDTIANFVRQGLKLMEGAGPRPPRVLFSAHGLPKRVVQRGDPYQWQVERTASAVVDRLALPDLDWVVCYQSRVGPMEWIGPATDAEIERAGGQRTPVIVAPIAFVSEHSETLVELDVEYRHLAHEVGVPRYIRVPTVQVAEPFIEALAELVRHAAQAGDAVGHGPHETTCPARLGRCPLARAAR